MRTSYDSSDILRRGTWTRITLSSRFSLADRAEIPDVAVHQIALRAVVQGAGDEALRRLDRQVRHLAPEVFHRLLLLVLDLLLPLLDEVLGLLAGLGQDLAAHDLGLALPLLDQGRDLAPRLRQALLVAARGLLRLGPGLLRLVERVLDGLFPLRERRQERSPGELAQEERQDEERDERPEDRADLRCDEALPHGLLPLLERQQDADDQG